MPDIDNRIVNMLFKNEQFEKRANQTMDTLDKLEKKLKLPDSSDAFNSISKAMSSVNVSGIQNGLDRISDRFSNLGIIGMTVLQNLTNSAINLGKNIALAIPNQIIQGGKTRALNIEQAKFQLSGLGVAWEDIYDNIDKAVLGTAYGLDEAAKVASQLAASGVAYGDAQSDMAHALRGISGVAAMTNSSYEEIGSIFTTVAGQGKLMTMQLRQLESRGLNAAAKLGEVLGKSEEQIRDMVTKGKIDFLTFANAMDEAFGEHATKANETFTGAFSNMKAALSRIGADFATPILKTSRDVFNALRVAFDKIRKGFTKAFAENEFTEFMNNLSRFFTNEVLKWDFSWVGKIVDGAKSAANAIAEYLAPAVDMLNGGLSQKINAKRILEELGSGLHVSDADLLSLPLVNAADLVKAGWEDAGEGISAFYATMYNQMDSEGNVVGRIFTPVYVDENGQTKIMTPDELYKYQEELWAGTRDDDLHLKVGGWQYNLENDSVELLKSQEEIIDRITKARQVYMLATPAIDNFRSSISNILSVFKEIGKKVGKAWHTIFPGTVMEKMVKFSDGILSFSERIKTVTQNIKDFFDPKFIRYQGVEGFANSLAVDRLDKIERFFSGLFSIFSLGKQAVEGLARGFRKLIDPLSSKIAPFADTLLTGAGSFGDWLTSLNNAAQETDFFGQKFEAAADWILNAVDNIKNAFTTAKQWSTDAWSWISEKFAGIWDSIGPTVTSIWGHLQRFWENLKTFFSNLLKGDQIHIEFKGIKGFFSWLSENVDWSSVLNAAEKVFEFIGTVVNGLLGIIDSALGGDADGVASGISVISDALITLAGVNLGTSLAAGGAAIIDFIGTLGSLSLAAMADWNVGFFTNMGKAILMIAGSMWLISTIDQDKLILSTTTILLIVNAMKGVYQVLNGSNLASEGEKAAGTAEKTVGFWNRIGNSITNFTDILTGKLAANLIGFAKAKIILAFAKAVLMIAAAVWIISTIPTEKLVMAFIAVIGIMVTLQWAFKQLTTAMNGMKKMKAKNIKALSEMLTKLAVSILLIAVAMKLIGSLDSDKLIMSFLAVVGLMVALKYMVQEFAKISTSVKAGKMKVISSMLISMAAALLILSVSVALLSALDPYKMAGGVIAMAALMYMMTTSIQSLVKSVSDGKASIGKMIFMAAMIVLLTAALTVLAVAITGMSFLNQVNLWSSVGALVAVLYLMIGALAILGKMASKTEQGASGMMAMAASILILSVSMSFIGGALKKLGKMDWKQLAAGTIAMIVTLYAMIGALALLKKVAGKDEGGAGALAGMAASILILAVAMRILGTTIALVGSIGWKSMIGVLSISYALLAFIGAAALIDKYDLEKSLYKLAGAVALFGVGVALFGAGLLLAAVAVTMFSGSIGVLGVAVVTLLGAILTGIVTLAPMITEAIVALVESIVDALVQSVDTIANGVGALIVSVIKAVIKYEPVIMYGLGVLLFDILAFLGALVPDLVDDLVKLILILINSLSLAIVENGKAIGEAIRNLVLSLGQFVWEALDGLFGPLIEKLFPDFYAQMEEVMNVGHNDLINSLTESNAELRAGMEENGEAMKEGWDNAISGFDPLETVQDTVDSSLEGLGGMDLMSTDWANDLTSQFGDVGDLGGEEYGTHLSGSFEDLSGTVGSSVDSVVDSVDRAKTDYKSTGRTSGRYYGDGVDSGAREKGTKVYNSGVYLANQLNRGFTNTTEIQSPSKVAMKYGRYWGEGIAIGVSSMSTTVTDAGANLANLAIDTMRDTLLRVNDILNGNIDDTITIRPVVDLSNVYSGAAAINSAFGSQAYSLNSGINVPNLAYGLRGAQSEEKEEDIPASAVTNNFYVQKMDEGQIDYFVNRVNSQLGAKV